MPTFLYPSLAIAGAAAAAVPVIVHLLNRRRFRVVQWAAMDFLREALTRSRRMMELRDILLLLLRAACLLIFGLALARPYWKGSSEAAVDPNQPVHAVVLVDNSLSMSYQTPDGILLDDAKAKAKDFIAGLPGSSLISVLPTCESENLINYSPYSRREDALEALAAIQPVDREARASAVIDLALNACQRTASAGGRRIFLVTDQQVANWSADAEKDHLKQLPSPMQVVQVTPDKIENAWVADVRLSEGVANVQTPAVFVATVGYQGTEERKDIPVSLKIDGKQVATKLIDLQPGQTRDVIFSDIEFAAAEDNRANGLKSVRYAAVEVSIGGDQASFDRLPGDNRRSIVIPVAESLPVVFVDAQGTHEDPKNKIFGDTWWLRRWLAPPSDTPDGKKPLVEIRHMGIEDLDRKALADARLAVVAGIGRPSKEEVSLLRQYVEQGGNLLLAAGGSFDPAAWSDTAWDNGLGILPSPLEATAQGYVRDDVRWGTAKTNPLTLNFDSAEHPFFRPEGVGEDNLRESLGPPVVFLKVVVADCDKAAADLAAEAAKKHFGELAEIDAKLASLKAVANADAMQGKIADLRQEREKIEPSWLAWNTAGEAGDAGQLPVKDLAQRAEPEVLARYNNNLPMLVRRRWGRGQVLFLTTSLSPEWTTLHELQQSAWLMDRIARSLISETLTAYNVDSEKGLVLPVAVGDHGAHFTLTDPAGKSKDLSVDALGGERYGIGLSDLRLRGIYRVKAARSETAPGAAAPSPAAPDSAVLLWDIPIAVNGPAAESKLVPDQRSPGEKSFADVSAETYGDAPVQIQGIDLWKWLVCLVLVGLLAEFFLAARSTTTVEAA